jgi:hypothetical protein
MKSIALTSFIILFLTILANVWNVVLVLFIRQVPIVVVAKRTNVKLTMNLALHAMIGKRRLGTRNDNKQILSQSMEWPPTIPGLQAWPCLLMEHE